jgi:hypothetical protein
MATSDPVLAKTALDVLADRGVRFAVLHKESAIASGSILSDVDLVVDQDPREIIAQNVPALHRVGLHPIVVWPYDVASTATVFLALPDGSDGVQIDFLRDPTGAGRYGVRSTVLLEDAQPGERWPTIRADHQFLYLIRKRSCKGEADELARLLASVSDPEKRQLGMETQKLFSPSAAERLRSLLEPAVRRDRERLDVHPASDSLRLLGRLRHPIGFWVEVVGDGASACARALSARFGRYLPWTQAEQRPRVQAEPFWWCRNVAPVRWRAGLFVSWSRSPGRIPRADSTFASDRGSLDDISGRVVGAMERRVLR